MSLCVWILLMNKPGLPPPPDRAHTLTPPSAPPLLPLLAAGFRVTQWTQETGSGPGAPGEAWERVPPHVWRSPRSETRGVLLAISFQCMGIGVGGCGVRGGHAVTRACVRKRAGETRGLLHSSDTPPPSLSCSAGLLSATLPISCLQKGVFSSCPALRGLSQSCIFGITQPFWAWLLASSPTLPDSLWLSEAALGPSHPAASTMAGCRKETAGAGGKGCHVPCPQPLCHAHPSPRSPLTGRQMSQGASPKTTSQMAGAAPQGMFRQGGGSGVERGRQEGRSSGAGSVMEEESGECGPSGEVVGLGGWRPALGGEKLLVQHLSASHRAGETLVTRNMGLTGSRT